MAHPVGHNLFEVEIHNAILPRVATGTSQPWAIGRNLFEVNAGMPKDVYKDKPVVWVTHLSCARFE